MKESKPDPAPVAGGGPLALCIFAGAAIGIAAGQAVLGIVIGTAVGALIALGIYLADRGRRG